MYIKQNKYKQDDCVSNNINEIAPQQPSCNIYNYIYITHECINNNNQL